MPTANPFPSSQPSQPQSLSQPQPVPALNLFPLNDSFIPKHIHLTQRVKIGRQTNAKTVPGERNGYFDSKVLSRAHAEVWEEGGKVYIKDVKSSNGTFINGERLSAEGVESEPFELKSDDIVEFGIDIVGEDNKTIIHHKVAARVTVLISPEDALVPPPSHLSSHPQQPQASFQPNPLRRGPGLAPPNPAAGLGSMGAPAGRPAATKSGLTFEHILSRLQNGLLQSRETGQELGRLGDQIGDIGDTLGGNNPGPIHTYPQTLPPVRPHIPEAPQPHQQQPTVPSHLPPSSTHPSAQSSALSNGAQLSSSGNGESGSQTQLSPTTLATITETQHTLTSIQETLAAHVEKVAALGDLAAEHEAMKREVGVLRGLVGGVRSGAVGDGGAEGWRHGEGFRSELGGDHRQDEDDNDDARSIATITDARDRDQDHDRAEEEDAEERRARPGLRPRTPEPFGRDDDGDGDDEVLGSSTSHPRAASPRVSSPQLPASPHHGPSSPAHASSPPTSPARNDRHPPQSDDLLTSRLTALADQLETALALSRALQAQQSAAQVTIEGLEKKVGMLEGIVKAGGAQAQDQPQSPPSSPAHAPTQSPTSPSHPAPSFSPSPPTHAQQQPSPQESHISPTLELLTWQRGVDAAWSSVREEWATERARLDRAREEWEGRVRDVEEGLRGVRASTGVGGVGGGVGVDGAGLLGLVTPPSPRSLSADSGRPRRKKSRSRSGGGGKRSRSPGRAGVNVGVSAIGAGGNGNGNGAAYLDSRVFKTEESDGVIHLHGEDRLGNGSTRVLALRPKDEAGVGAGASTHRHNVPIASVSTAVGVILLSVAAAAVYRVRE